MNNLTVNTTTDLLKKVYYTALGRERWGNKLNNVKVEDLNDIVIDDEIDKNPQTNIKLTSEVENRNEVKLKLSNLPTSSDISSINIKYKEDSSDEYKNIIVNSGIESDGEYRITEFDKI